MTEYHRKGILRDAAAIRLFFTTAYGTLWKLDTASALADKPTYDLAKYMTCESLIGLLNSQVDSVVFGCYMRLLGESATAKDTTASRDKSINALTKRYQFDHTALPNWDAVEQIKNDANALKHRQGHEFWDNNGLQAAPIPSFDYKAVLARIDPVAEWCIAFADQAYLPRGS